MPARRRWIAAVAAFGVGAASSVGAQDPRGQDAPRAAPVPPASTAARGRAALVGRVRTPDSLALADAELTVLGDGHGTARTGDGRSVRTGPGGIFHLDSIVPGRYLVRVRRLGYEPLYFSATLDGGQARRLDLEMSALPARLAGVNVTAESGYNAFTEKRFRDFDFRRKAGFGVFYTSDDLRPYRGRLLSDVLPYIALAGLQRARFESALDAGLGCRNVRGAAYAGFANPYSARGAGGWGRGAAPFGAGRIACVSLNGAPAVEAAAASDFSVDEIEALEITGSTLVVWLGTSAESE